MSTAGRIEAGKIVSQDEENPTEKTLDRFVIPGQVMPEESPLAALLATADIRVVLSYRAARPWDLIVSVDRLADLANRVKKYGLVGLGEAYVDGWWDCQALDQFFDRALRADLPAKLAWHPRVIADYWRQKLLNLQSKPRAKKNVAEHYDLGNDVFEATLDPYMQYSCGYWACASNVNQAQTDKLDMICRKLGLQKGMTLLDTGCGWGGLAQFAAENYGVTVTGITLSIEQMKFAEKKCAGLPATFILADYRSMYRQYDRIVSVGMLEHVGQKNLGDYARVVHRCLKPGGLALLHFFATRDSFPNRIHSEVMWIEKYIFPGLVVPSLKQIGAAIDGLFVLEDQHNFGADYDPTLMAWCENFKRSWHDNSHGYLKGKYGPRFYRMWEYYLLSCAGAFRARKYQLWQLVLSKEGVPGGYRRPPV